MIGWLVGWKKIAEFTDLSVKTAKLYHKKYGMPVLRGPKNKPIALPDMLDLWIIEFHNKKKKSKIDFTSNITNNFPKYSSK